MADPFSEANRPNVVFVIADDHRHDVMSCRGNSHIETPNLDRLAEEGCSFENAFTTTAICAPSRGAFLTGKYPHRAGTPLMPWKNNTFLRGQWPFPARLGDSGYYAAHVGKWHLGEGHRPKDGYDYWAGFEWLGEFQDPMVHVNGEPRAFDGYADDVLADLATERIAHCADADRPFCLTVGLKAPHLPFDYPARYDDALADVEIPKPASFDEDYERTGKQPLDGNTIEIEQFAGGLPLFDGEWDDYVKSYYRAVMGIDDAVGAIADALNSAGIADKTILIYTSDHGYSHGEHGLTEKHYAYEEAIRIPMIVRYPPLTGDGGHRPTEMVLNVDVAPTLHDVCSVETVEEMDGRSLRPLLGGNAERADWRDEFLYVFEDRREGLLTQVAVRTDCYKLVTYPNYDHRELYDLQGDPREMTNLIEDPRYEDVRRDLLDRLDRLRDETDYVPRVERPVTSCHVLGPVTPTDLGEVPERLFPHGDPDLREPVEVGDETLRWIHLDAEDGAYDLAAGFDATAPPNSDDAVVFVAIPLRRRGDRDPFVEIRFDPFREGRAYADGEEIWTFDRERGGAAYNPPLINECTVSVLELRATGDGDWTFATTIIHPAGRVAVDP